MTDIRTTWVVQTGTGDWSIAGGALASGDDLSTAVLISLFTDRQANDDDTPPDGGGDRRGWWGDKDEAVPIGSRLWLLDRERLTQAVANTAKIYMQEALQWLISDEVASGVVVAVVIASSSQLNSLITITRQDGAVVPLQFNWVWGQV